jgi:Na+(H+)/acetate symporter ActP
MASSRRTGKGVHPVANGMATAADWMSAASFISMAGLIAFKGFDASVYLMGWTGGYVLLALLLAPYLRKFTVPKVADARYSAGWALVFIALLYTTAPAVAAMARLNLLAISSSISHDLLKGVFAKGISEKGELLAGRIGMTAAIIVAGYLGLNPPGFAAQVVALAFGLAASSIFPALLMGIFDRRASGAGAVLGMLSGLLSCAFGASTSPTGSCVPSPWHSCSPAFSSTYARCTIRRGCSGSCTSTCWSTRAPTGSLSPTRSPTPSNTVRRSASSATSCSSAAAITTIPSISSIGGPCLWSIWRGFMRSPLDFQGSMPSSDWKARPMSRH